MMVVCFLHCIKLIGDDTRVNVALVVIRIMSDDKMPTHDDKVDNLMLRYVVREAVEREMVNTLAPLRDQIQVVNGIVKQLNTDLIVQKTRFEDIEAIVTGNARLGLKGLVTVVNDLQTSMELKISALQTSMDARFRDIDTLFEQVNTRFDAADDQRDTLINYAKGARWAIGALIVLGLFDNSSILGGWLASLVKLIP